MVNKLVNRLKSLKGIDVFYTNYQSSKDINDAPLSIWFNVTDNEGLFFLTRCVDRRYWEYGHIWGIDLSVGDIVVNNLLPITYRLHSGSSIFDTNTQIESLINNMDYHAKHINFIKGFKLDISGYYNSIGSIRDRKINEIIS